MSKKFEIKIQDLPRIVDFALMEFKNSVKLPEDPRSQQAYLFIKGLEHFLASKVDINFTIENLDKEKGEYGDVE